MKKVAENHHLHKREGVWYYRRRVPTHLLETFGKPVIQLSLRTTSKKVAIGRREVRDVEWSARFAKAEADLKRPGTFADQTPAAQKRTLTEPLAIQIVQKYVEETDQWRSNAALADPPQNSEERTECEMNIALELAIARDQAHPDDHIEYISRSYEEIFSSADVMVDEKSFSIAAVLDLVKRACIEVERRALARVRDDHGHRFFDKLFDPASPPPVTVGELSEQFLAHEREEAVALKRAQKTIDTKHASLALVREILGDDTLVRDINWDVCRRFCSTLAKVPTNRTKKYKGLPLEEAIARAQDDGGSALSYITQSQYLATLKELLEMAVKKDLIRTNYAKELRPLKVDDLARDMKRVPFDLEQLKAFFTSEYYRACADAEDFPYRHADKDWRFWFPLLTLFTGMRPKEVFQMHVTDVKQTPAGTWFFDIVATTDEDDERAPELTKTTKTATSRRQVPVHPELEKLGFFAFVEEQRKASNDPLLFRGITRNKYNDPAHYPLKRFREKYLKEAIALRPRQSAYSFRHTWRDAARRISASDDFLKAIGAWTDGTTTSDNYGSKHHPDLYAKDMARIAYEGLDLSHLYVKATSP